MKTANVLILLMNSVKKTVIDLPIFLDIDNVMCKLLKDGISKIQFLFIIRGFTAQFVFLYFAWITLHCQLEVSIF